MRAIALVALTAVASACAPLYVRSHTVSNADRELVLEAAATSARAIGLTAIVVDTAGGRVTASRDVQFVVSEAGGPNRCTADSQCWGSAYHPMTRRVRWAIAARLVPRADGRLDVRAELDVPESSASASSYKDCVLRSYLTLVELTLDRRPYPRRYCRIQ